jgi:hypothetical protein
MEKGVTMRLLSRRPSPALVVACLALLVALGGTSIAAVSALPSGSVGTAQLKNNAVTSTKLKDGQVKSADIANSTIVSGDVRNGSLLRADFKAGQIPAGPQGPAGPLGPPGISAVERRDVSSPSNSVNSKSIETVCPSGKRVIGGGARVIGAGAVKVSIAESFPDSDGTKWNVVAREVDATAAAWQLTGYALCAVVAA